MMYPKKQTKKKRKRHKKSILHSRDGTCYLCIKLHDDHRYHTVLQEHHIYGGSNRDTSEAEGFKIYLCLPHHTDGSEAVHNNIKNMRLLQQECQRAYETTHSRAEFIQLIGRNYLEV